MVNRVDIGKHIIQLFYVTANLHFSHIETIQNVKLQPVALVGFPP
jgi:hypothetical protein